MWYMLCILVILFLCVHFAKMIRLYLVLIEHGIPFFRFILLYLKTTCVNLIIPFKLGEIYRIYEIKKETKLWQVGVLSVLIDRFFDILALFIVLLPFDLFFDKSISIITGIFAAGIFLIVLFYLTILPTYEYLNKYIIMYKTSKRSMVVLKGLEIVKQWYDFAAQLIKGRFALITISSLMGWLFEVLALKCLASLIKLPFAIGDFSKYITAIFLQGENMLVEYYSIGSALLLFALVIILYIVYFFRIKKRT